MERVLEACLSNFNNPNRALNPKLVIITRQPTGQFGKLSVLMALMRPCNSVVFHVDDGVHILDEFVTGSSVHGVALPFGVRSSIFRFRGKSRLSVGI